MPYTLGGDASVSSSIQPGMAALPGLSGAPLSTQGTLFKEFRFKEGPTAHVSAHLAAISGQYITNGLNTKQRTPLPTIFEYYRKHTSPTKNALNAWWVADRSDPYNRFNFSSHQRYGAQYGANFIQPNTILSSRNVSSLGNPKSFGSAEMEKIAQLRGYTDKNFINQFHPGDAGVQNTPEEKKRLWNFVQRSLKSASEGKFDNPFGLGPNVMNNDMLQAYFAGEILREFKPELMALNLFEIDLGHTDFTLYCNNMRRADFALNHLWQTIQSIPEMKDDTILIAVPEHGRNLQPNTLKDANGRFALDHTSDATSREIFCMVLGPPGKVKQGQIINQVMGESIDVVPTIAKILGFWDKIPLRLKGRPLEAPFV